MPSIIANLIQSSLKLILPVIYGFFVALYIVYKCVRHPFTALRRREMGATTRKALADPSLGDHRRVFLSDRGISLHYVESGPADGEVLLLVHGFPEFWYSWRHQIRAFSSKYRVVALDQRGYGDSDKPNAVKDYDIDELIGDLKSLIGSLGVDKAHVVGHDWGGAVVWALLLRYPEVIDKVVICNCPFPSVIMKFMSSNPKQLLMSWYMFFYQLPHVPELFMRLCDYEFLESAIWTSPKQGLTNKAAFSRADMEIWKDVFAESGFTGPINFYRASFRKRAPGKTERPKVTNPVLIIWGTNDGFLHRDLAEASAKAVENGRVEFVEGASHWVQQDEPDKVNRLMGEFLAGGSRGAKKSE